MDSNPISLSELWILLLIWTAFQRKIIQKVKEISSPNSLVRWSIHFSEQQQKKMPHFCNHLLLFTEQNIPKKTTNKICREFQWHWVAKNFPLDRMITRWVEVSGGGGIKTVYKFFDTSLKFPPLKYVLASVTDFYWTESGETDLLCGKAHP